MHMSAIARCGRLILLTGLLSPALALPSPAVAALPETLTVNATSAVPQLTQTEFDPARTYMVTATGTTSVWEGVSDVIDPLYCFTSESCEASGPLPVRTALLRVDDMGLDEFVGLVPGNVPYDSSHRYELEFTGVAGNIQLHFNDSVYSDNSGSYEVTFEEKPVAPEPPPAPPASPGPPPAPTVLKKARAPAPPDFATAVFDGTTLYLRLKCPARFKPECVGTAAGFTSRARCTRSRGRRQCQAVNPITASASAKQKPNTWKVFKLKVKPKFQPVVTKMAERANKKLLYVRELIHAKGFENGRAQAVYHVYRVLTAPG